MSHHDGISAVKVCGVASRSDAFLVGKLARQGLPPSVEVLLGVILWPGSKRSVHHSVAKEIAEAARSFDIKPVALFVDESPDEIQDLCEKCKIEIAQLHGEKCRKSVAMTGLPSSLQWINVVDVRSDGSLCDDENAAEGIHSATSPPIWTIYDAPGGGTGIPFNWASFSPPNVPWILAGGLNPDNVSKAVSLLNPNGVDVASGVTKSDKVRKDPEKLLSFFRNVADLHMPQ